MPGHEESVVGGRAFVRGGVPLEGVTLRFYERGFGGEARPVAEAVTARDGAYSVEAPSGTDPAHLEVRMVTREGDEVPVAVSGDGLLDGHGLDVVVPAEAARRDVVEYDRLLADLAPHIGDARLGDARESEERRDISLLHQRTKRDARLIAMAASSDRLAEETGLSGAAVYGMLRAGLPADADALASVDPETVGKALGTASEGGVVRLTKRQIKDAEAAFGAFAKERRRKLRVDGTVSTIGDLLDASGLGDAQLDAFEGLLAQQAAGAVDSTKLWQEADELGLPTAHLQLVSQLGQLTLGNAPLIGALADEITDAGSLSRGLLDAKLYQPASWKARIQDLAEADGGIGALVPQIYAGNDAERLDAYAADLAATVRRTYPTQVIATMVTGDELRLPQADDTHQRHVGTFLEHAAEAGFELGRTPVNSYLSEHGEELLARLDARRDEQAILEDLKTLSRMYQVTRTDEALAAMLGAGFRSAHEIAELTESEFIGQFGTLFDCPAEASLTYRKAQQIGVVSYTFLGEVRAAPGGAGPSALAPAPLDLERLRAQFPTMEDLFGSLDYDACEGCRSVLSPAAYLVDLLKFLDRTDKGWESLVEKWPDTHGGAAYPFETKKAWQDAGSPAAAPTPYEVLTEGRRGDLAALPLTCANTHTTLPYIDLVNEILEFFLVHGELGEAAAYDTGDADQADLAAEPRHLLPAAYDLLRQARYPLSLPFDLWHETSRRFSGHFETPRWELLDALCPTTELFPKADEAYGQAAVLFERLGLPPDEVDLLTEKDVEADWLRLYGLERRQNEPEAEHTQRVAALANARTLSRRLGVTYRELAALVRTGFVNPGLPVLARLRRLGVPVDDVVRYMDQQSPGAFDAAARAAFEQELGPDGLAWLRKAWNAGDFEHVLVLASPTATSGFHETALRRGGGATAKPMDFVLLNFFVRLWRRLGWSIEDADRALLAFLPTRPNPRTKRRLGKALRSALIGLGHLAELADALGVPPERRPSLLPVWAGLDERTYTTLFLTGTAGTRDPIFDDPGGHYLTRPYRGVQRPFEFDPAKPENRSKGNVPLATHLPPVQAALKLSAADIARVLAVRGQTVATAPLNMEVLSLLHRHALLARLLHLSVADLVALVDLSGVDPFAALRETVVTRTTDDAARLAPAFAALAGEVGASGLSVPALEYLLRHRFDPVGPFRNAAAPPLGLVRDLAAEVARIRAEHAEPADPLTFTDEDLARKLALVLPADAVAAFLAAWNGAAVDEDVWSRHLLRRQVPGVGTAGFLTAADRAVLFAPAPAPADQAAEAARRQRLSRALLPYLQDRLIRDAVLARVAAALDAAPALVEALLTRPELLDDPVTPGAPLLPRYVDAARTGATLTELGGGARRLSGYLEAPASGPYRFSVKAPPGTAIELRFDHLPEPLVRGETSAGDPERSGVAELKAGTLYGFTLEHTGGAAATLSVEASELPQRPVERLAVYGRESVDLLHRAHLLVDKVVRLADDLRLTEAELRHFSAHAADFGGVDLGALPTQVADDTPAGAVRLFGRVRRLIAYTRLRESLAAEPADLLGLFALGRVTLSAAPTAETREQVLHAACACLARISRREPATVRAAARELGFDTATPAGTVVVVPELVNEMGAGRLWRVLALATRLGVDPGTLRLWAAPRPGALTAHTVRDAVKARYEPEQWRRVAKPIFDALRQARRDALVARIMHLEGFAQADQLFEHFLVDQGTQPVVETTRIRLALSSLQTFVQRCLLSLEPGVHPSAIRANEWQWMRRYRVWEANRKIFLWPENWLEPEFRDDKTHLYDELESALMESDLDDEHAEAAFLGYLRGLEGIARLEVRAVYQEDKPGDETGTTLHVLARTFASPHKYFYRRYAYRMWSPWVPVTTDIESDHVTVAVWRNRVHVLWLTFLDRPSADAGNIGSSKATEVTLNQLSGLRPARTMQVQLSWTELLEGEWSKPATSGFVMQESVPKHFDPKYEFVQAEVDAEGDLLVRVHGDINHLFRMVSKVSAPLVESASEALQEPLFDQHGMQQTRYVSDDGISITYVPITTTEDGKTVHGEPKSVALFVEPGASWLVISPRPPVPHHVPDQDRRAWLSERERLVAPFFFADDRHTFYVEPTLTVETIEETHWLIELLWSGRAGTAYRDELQLDEHALVAFDGELIGADGRAKDGQRRRARARAGLSGHRGGHNR